MRLAIAAAIFALYGCATAPKGAVIISDLGELPTIQQERAALLAKVTIGMSLAEFQAAAPDAYLASENADVAAYEVATVKTYVTHNDISRQNIIWGAGSPTPRTTKQRLWFYFVAARLVKWGAPDEWPREPTAVKTK